MIIHRVLRAMPSYLYFECDELVSAEYNGADIADKYSNDNNYFYFDPDYSETMAEGKVKIKYKEGNEVKDVEIYIQHVRRGK